MRHPDRNKPFRVSRQQGFSILEVLVAFVIMSLSLAALYQSVAGSLRSVDVAEHYVRATLLAKSLSARQSSVIAEGMDLSGDTEDDFHWRIRSIASSDILDLNGQEELGEGLVPVEIEVSWGQGAPRAVRMVTFYPVSDP